MVLIAMAGLPATGKSTVAHMLGTLLDAPVLDKDAIRCAVFAPRFVAYAQSQDDLCMRIAYQAAEYLLLAMGRQFVILDGRTFRRTEHVDELVTFARRLDHALCVLECVCSEGTARKRIEAQRALGSHPAENRTFDLYRSLRAEFQEIHAEKLVLNTDSGTVDACARDALDYVRRVPAQR